MRHTCAKRNGYWKVAGARPVEALARCRLSHGLPASTGDSP